MRDKKKMAFCVLAIGTAVTAIVGGMVTLILTMKPVANIVRSNREYYDN